ncbi:hypothetical protein V865_007393 [Kwoniella europaea PYCC6329]|uniref:FAD/NAD(P)-binding domain-containing protein n=1 Tax=Kwoniella europaea PYCC6329 TaxID=1423913 RepID=A0AAX4KUK1_9TREE
MTVDQQAFKNIVIIGASIAGHEAANHLSSNLPPNYRILLIDARSFAWWPITILRAVVTPGWEYKLTIPLTTDRVFKRGTPHQVIAPNKVISLKESSVVLERPFEGSNEVPFFRCVIATGASQPLPTMPGWNQTESEFIESLKAAQRDVEKAKKVVVVGGGAVGVEIAGEIAAHHPDKSVTLVHKDYGLLSPTPPDEIQGKVQQGGKEVGSYSSPPTDPRLSIELKKICDKLGIKVILNDRVIIPPCASPYLPKEVEDEEDEEDGRIKNAHESENQGKLPKAWNGHFGLQPSLVTLKLKSGKSLEADYVYPGCGMKPNSKLVRDVDEGALDGELIRVNEYLKVTTKNPGESIFSKERYYAVGDVCSSPGFKIARTAIVNAPKAATNIINEIKEKPLSKYSAGPISHLDLPLGPNEGAGMTNFGWLGTWVFGSRFTTMIRGKTSGTERVFVGRFRGEKKSEIVFD